MFKRFWIICSVIGAGLAVLSILGLSSLGMHEKGLRAERQQEFIAVARQISFDVKHKVDTFLQTEQARPYTDYQYFYVPVASNQAAALVRSPLGDTLSNGLAYGYFQLDNSGQVSTPYAASFPQASTPTQSYVNNLNQNLLPSLANGETMQVRRIEPTSTQPQEASAQWSAGRLDLANFTNRNLSAQVSNAQEQSNEAGEQEITGSIRDNQTQMDMKTATSFAKGAESRRARYPINLDEAQQQTQVMSQDRANYEFNTYNNDILQQQEEAVPPEVMAQQSRAQAAESQQTEQQDSREQAQQSLQFQAQQQDAQDYVFTQEQRQTTVQPIPEQLSSAQTNTQQQTQFNRLAAQGDTVQVRIEPFVPMTVPETDGSQTLFAGQVFLLRHIQIEDKHFVQGFRLDESQLLDQISESAQQFIRRGMGFDVSKTELPEAAYTAVLDFGFGEVMLNLLERQPGWIPDRVAYIRNWFFAILAIVWLAVIVALAAFWRNIHDQLQLSRKKDDFISAVSHELRTPLTSIRMYTEMLEKDWVPTDRKRREYYATMRQESERLTRLIENVLDFSRIQRGKKRYQFTLGDVNECVSDVVRMMQPCAERAGFELICKADDLQPFMFDRDAVVQIVINLLDNALKYANGTQDKRIIIRTRKQKEYAVIEVEDHGPGIARSQQKKIFETFYRCGDESTRQTTGTGLGLALVKRFAEAHHGFVEIMNAKPTGALFRVALEQTV